MPATEQSPATKLSVAILISGRGSNLQALINSMTAGELAIDIRTVISSRADAEGLVRARNAGIKTHVVEHTDYPERAAFDNKLTEAIDACKPELIILAGFMRILTDTFVKNYRGRLINIHPSLLPEFPGLNTHQRAIDASKKESGASVHYVTEKVDGGPVFMQVRVPIEPNDNAKTLAARVLTAEHRLLPEAIRWIAEKRVELDHNGKVQMDGCLLVTPVVI